MSELEGSLREYFHAEVDDIPNPISLPRSVRMRVRRRRAVKFSGAVAAVLLAVGLLVAYAAPKIDRSPSTDVAALLPGGVTVAPPPAAPPASVHIPRELPVIEAVGTVSGQILEVRDGRLVVTDPITARVMRSIEVAPVPARDTVFEARWSPDRTSIYLTFRNGCVGGLASYGIQRIPATGGAPVPVTSGNDFGFSISPDGTRVALVRLSSGCGAHTLVVRDLATGVESTRELTNGILNRVDWAGNDRLVIGATVQNGRPRVLIAAATGSDSLDLAVPLVNGTLLTARTVNGAAHVIVVRAGGALVDVDPIALVARGTLGAVGRALVEASALDATGTRLAAYLESGQGRAARSRIYGGDAAATVLPTHARPVDWSG